MTKTRTKQKKQIEEIQFSIIYGFDATDDCSIRPLTPKNKRLWSQTEGDKDRNYADLGGHWRKGKHRKYCAILNDEQLLEFLSEQSLKYDCDGSSLGAPGFGYSMCAAMCFCCNDSSAMCCANVTPAGSPRTLRAFVARMGFAEPATRELWGALKQATFELIRRGIAELLNEKRGAEVR